MIFTDLIAELIVGHFRGFFDWAYPKRNDPVAGEWIKLFMYRITCCVGVILLVAGLLGGSIGPWAPGACGLIFAGIALLIELRWGSVREAYNLEYPWQRYPMSEWGKLTQLVVNRVAFVACPVLLIVSVVAVLAT